MYKQTKLHYAAVAACAGAIMWMGLAMSTADAAASSSITTWQPFGTGFVADTTEHHSGVDSVRCQTDSPTASYGAFETLNLDQAVASPVYISGWSKSVDVGGTPNGDYSVYADLTFQDGTNLWAQTSNFGTGTHNWQRRHLVILPPKPLKSMNVYAIFRNHPGKVWFDDFEAHAFDRKALFDGQELKAPTMSSNSFGGRWYVRDVATGSSLVPLRAGSVVDGIKVTGLKTTAGGKIINCSVRNVSSHTRCVTLYYAERFDGQDPRWWNDVRDRQPVGDDVEYGNLEQTAVGANGHRSLYPFGCVTSNVKGRALSIPPSVEPCVHRIVYNRGARILFAAFDMALTPAGDRTGHDRTSVGVARYDVDPAWGFRDAAAKFYALFPEAFKRRSTKEGIWMPFTAPSKIEGLADFHIAYHEGDNSVDEDKKNGILSFRYVEPMTYWMPMAKSVPRTYDAALAQIETQAAKPVKNPHATDYQRDPVRQSQSVLYSGTRDMSGRLNVSFQNAPWCDGAVWVMNPDPHLTAPAGKWTKARLNQLGEPSFDKANQPDGEFLDSLEMWPDTLDYGNASLRSAPETLTFTPDTFRPVIPTWFSVYEATKSLSNDLHRHGRLLMANAVPWTFTHYGPLLDIMGTETNMYTDGQFVGEDDSRFNLRRTLCYHKPYLLLMNTDFSKIDNAEIELYFQLCMFYGVMPSMYSANAASDPYWENPTFYNRDRPLFKKYLPVIEKISAAGWEPITWAKSDSPAVWLERYGRRYVTVHNSTRQAVDTTVSLDHVQTLWDRPVKAVDAISGEVIPIVRTSIDATFHLKLNAMQSRVISIIPSTSK